MSASSRSPAERARKIVSTVLQRVQRQHTQAAIAAELGKSDSTVSRLLSEHLENLSLVLAHSGLKVVDVEAVCVDKNIYASMAHIASKAMADPEVAEKLVWEDD